MKARYDPQNAERVIFQNTSYAFAIAGGAIMLGGLVALILVPGWARLAGLLVIAFGFIFIAVADFNQIIVDGQARSLEFRHRTLLKRWSETHALDDFCGVGLQMTRGENSLLYRIAFFKNDGSAIPISGSYDNINLAGKQRDLALLSDLGKLPIIES